MIPVSDDINGTLYSIYTVNISVVNGSDTNPINLGDFITRILAGIFLLFYGIVGEVFYSLVLLSMARLAKDADGYKFLLSQGVADMTAAPVYSLIPGFILLIPSLAPREQDRYWIHVIMDGIWFSMVNHHLLVSWTRFTAVYYPHWFRALQIRTIALICAAVWACSLLISITFHNFPFWVIFYYEPAVYGMASADFDKYLTGGTSATYMTYHAIVLSAPLILYICTVYKLIIMGRKVKKTATVAPANVTFAVATAVLKFKGFKGTKVHSGTNNNNNNNNTNNINNANNTNDTNTSDGPQSSKGKPKEPVILKADIPIVMKNAADPSTTNPFTMAMGSKRSSIKNNSVSSSSSNSWKRELRIVLPCCINTILFIFGQVLITSNVVQGRLGAWFVLVSFSTNAFANSLLMVIFSTSIRNELKKVFVKN